MTKKAITSLTTKNSKTVRLIRQKNRLTIEPIYGKNDGESQDVSELEEVKKEAEKIFDVVRFKHNGFFDLRSGYVDPVETHHFPVRAYELLKVATCPQMFGSISSDLDRMSFKSKLQIIKFCIKYPELLSPFSSDESQSTFFLFKTEWNFHVARVQGKKDDFLNIDGLSFGSGFTEGKKGSRIIVLR